jgi:DNA-binding transcriptional LysR family regulator
MDIRDITYFLEVASTGRLREAAENCGVTQPAMSKAVHRLELEFGLVLFDRSATGMRLTDAGRVFQVHAQRLNADYADTVREANEIRAGSAGLLRVGSTNALLTRLVLPALTELLVKRPGMRSELHISPADELFERLAAGLLDIVVAATYGAKPKDLRAVSIGTDELVAVTRRGHKLHRGTGLALRDLVHYPWILTARGSISREALDATFRRNGLPPPIVTMQIEFMSAELLDVVRNSDLIALSSAQLVASQEAGSLQTIDLPELTIARDLSTFTRDQATLSPLAGEFVDCIQKLARRRTK